MDPNRVKKIREQGRLQCQHVPTNQKPASLGSKVTANDFWKRGPEWLSEPAQWPPSAILESSTEASAEMKIKRVLAVATCSHDAFDQLLENHPLHKCLRIGARVRRFISNCRSLSKDRSTGPLTSSDIEVEISWWIKRVQRDIEDTIEMEKVTAQLNLQPNEEGILESRGRIEGDYPIFLPREHTFTRKLVEQAHLATLHGGVGTTMAKVIDRYWVPKLRQLVKRVRSGFVFNRTNARHQENFQRHARLVQHHSKSLE